MTGVVSQITAQLPVQKLPEHLEEAGKAIRSLVQPDCYVGEVVSLGYSEALVQIHDFHRQKVGGIPALSFLLASRINPGTLPNVTEEDAMVILLRVMDHADLPNEDEARRVRVENAQRVSGEVSVNWDDKSVMDATTANALSYAGIRCRVIGTFYMNDHGDPPTPCWKLSFGSDISNYYPNKGLKVFKPNGTVLENIVNFRDPNIYTDTGIPMTPIGKVRYASTNRPFQQIGDVRVSITPTDLLGQKTALFGMTRTGKSNTTKIILKAIFADSVVSEFTLPGDWVLDPFAGRGTAIFAAATQGRFGVGIEINPVGWLYTRAKLCPATRQEVEERISWLGRIAQSYHDEAERLPDFFHYCYSLEVRCFLLAARDNLDWRHRKADWTLMAFILIHLHGKRTDSLSNQMRQTKAMSPQYAVEWWKQRDLRPPERDPVEFLKKKVAWRYAKGAPHLMGSSVYLGDSRTTLKRLGRAGARVRPIKLLLTSPPYQGVTNYFYDQWLRLWMMGGPNSPRSTGNACKAKFEGKQQYRAILFDVFASCKPLLTGDAVVYVRTDARSFTRECTTEVLQQVFPTKLIRCERQTLPTFTQTSLFHPTLESKGEVDLVLW